MTKFSCFCFLNNLNQPSGIDSQYSVDRVCHNWSHKLNISVINKFDNSDIIAIVVFDGCFFQTLQNFHITKSIKLYHYDSFQHFLFFNKIWKIIFSKIVKTKYNYKTVFSYMFEKIKTASFQVKNIWRCMSSLQYSNSCGLLSI